VHLYETHLCVANTAASQAFYTGVVGLEFAHRDLTRDIIFLWAGDDRRSMLGLWGPSTSYGRNVHESHLAFAVSLPELLAAGERLRRDGVVCQNFHAQETNEPSVIGWMPSAQLYFRDPDQHLVEFIALLDGDPEISFIGSLSEWQARRKPAVDSSR